MALVDDRTFRFLQRDFDTLPPDYRAHAYGVDYARVELAGGGELFLTRYGWKMSSLVVPQAWFAGNRYKREGRRLKGSTGTVYRVPTPEPVGATDSIIVKFSRVAQDVPLYIEGGVAAFTSHDVQHSAHFNDPYEEFGRVMELRRGPFGPGRPRIYTKKPLGIYSPPDRYQLWQLGRKEWLFEQHQERLHADQAKSSAGVFLSLDLNRDYILLYQWVKGQDAEVMYSEGMIPEEDMQELYFRSMYDLETNRFVMLDNKPRHLILRMKRNGELLRRRGMLTYAMIDFELLQPLAQWPKQE